MERGALPAPSISTPLQRLCVGGSSSSPSCSNSLVEMPGYFPSYCSHAVDESSLAIDNEAARISPQPRWDDSLLSSSISTAGSEIRAQPSCADSSTRTLVTSDKATEASVVSRQPSCGDHTMTYGNFEAACIIPQPCWDGSVLTSSVNGNTTERRQLHCGLNPTPTTSALTDLRQLSCDDSQSLPNDLGAVNSSPQPSWDGVLLTLSMAHGLTMALSVTSEGPFAAAQQLGRSLFR